MTNLQEPWWKQPPQRVRKSMTRHHRRALLRQRSPCHKTSLPQIPNLTPDEVHTLAIFTFTPDIHSMLLFSAHLRAQVTPIVMPKVSQSNIRLDLMFSCASRWTFTR